MIIGEEPGWNETFQKAYIRGRHYDADLGAKAL
jgi:hypothetical protein